MTSFSADQDGTIRKTYGHYNSLVSVARIVAETTSSHSHVVVVEFRAYVCASKKGQTHTRDCDRGSIPLLASLGSVQRMGKGSQLNGRLVTLVFGRASVVACRAATPLHLISLPLLHTRHHHIPRLPRIK